MHTPQIAVRETSSGWYQLRDRSGRCAMLFERMRNVPGVTIWSEGVYVIMNLPRNALVLLDPALVVGAELVVDAPPSELATSEVPLGRPLYPHQEEAVTWLLANRGGLLADDMGLGKTTAAAVAVARHATALPGLKLVVGPANVEGVWRRELCALGFISSPEAMASARGTRAYEANLRGDLDSGWLFVPYHLMDAWLSFIHLNRMGRVTGVIVDEAHWAKNPRSERGRASRVAATLADFVVLLTGTPISNRTNELWNVLTARDGGRTWGSQFEFRLRYCGAINDGHGYKDTGATNVDELHARMAARYMRRTAREAGLALPPFRREVFPVTVTDAERERYASSMADIGPDKIRRLVSDLASGSFGKDTLATMTRVRRLTTRYKMRATAELVSECHEQGQSVVVFTWQRATAATLCRNAPGRTYLITGEVPADEREKRMAEFQELGGTLFATLDAIKEGVTLTRASRVIIHDLSWVPSDVLQAEARVNRIGQRDPVTATWMLMPDSFDLFLVDAMRRKGAEIEKAIGIGDASAAAQVTAGIGFDVGRVDPVKLLSGWVQGPDGGAR